MEDDDQRSVELSSLQAIFPEMLFPDPQDPFTFTIEIPVQPATPVSVTFPAPVAVPPADHLGPAERQQQQLAHELGHLPALRVRATLPDGYPEAQPPLVRVSTAPAWLGPDVLARLEGEAERLWEEMGRDLVVFSFLDQVQQQAEAVFGLLGDGETLALGSELKLSLLDYDVRARKAQFDRETYDCGVCLEPKKGAACHKMTDCGHIFCLSCLQDFYNHAIKEGDLSSVRCLAPDCARQRAAANPARKPRPHVSPSELLQMGIAEAAVKRYVTLKHKTALERDKNTVYCPRAWCDGAARSKKHPAPDGLELADGEDASDDSDEGIGEGAEAAAAEREAAFDRSKLLSICEKCSFAFCSNCHRSWHGPLFRCRQRRRDGEMTEDERATMDYLREYTSPCPTCEALTQKTLGCNHMCCPRCETHFCYLCAAWLDPRNPYKHFNKDENGRGTSCYNRLWELEGGDGDDVDRYGAGPRELAPVVQRDRERERQEVPVGEAAPDVPANEVNADPRNRQRERGGREAERRGGEGEADAQPREEVAREGPLVLRLFDNVPRPAPPPAAPAQAPPQRGNHHRGGAAQRNQQPRGRGRGGRGRQNDRQARDGEGQAGGRGGGEEVGGMPPHLRVWVQRFVELALRDEEDLMDEEEEGEGEREGEGEDGEEEVPRGVADQRQGRERNRDRGRNRNNR